MPPKPAGAPSKSVAPHIPFGGLRPGAACFNLAPCRRSPLNHPTVSAACPPSSSSSANTTPGKPPAAGAA
jgi:hypothetical protein